MNFAVKSNCSFFFFSMKYYIYTSEVYDLNDVWCIKMYFLSFKFQFSLQTDMTRRQLEYEARQIRAAMEEQLGTCQDMEKRAQVYFFFLYERMEEVFQWFHWIIGSCIFKMCVNKVIPHSI